jgi:SAM-dependent methyltransferase
MAGSDREALQRRLDAFPVWHYRFEFDGGAATTISRHEYLARHEQRRRIMFDPLLRLCGGSLQGRRVLDLGCNAGWWSLAAIEAGADFVLGVDGRRMHVEQAELVFEAKGVERSRYRFDEADIFEQDLGGPFDVVLCLGLLYHVAEPVRLFRIMAAAMPELIVIDTDVSLLPFGAFMVTHEDIVENPLNALGCEVVLLPSRQAVIDLAKLFGFEAVALAHEAPADSGMADYRSMKRAAFICSRTMPLSSVARERTNAATLLRALARSRVALEWRRMKDRASRQARSRGLDPEPRLRPGPDVFWSVATRHRQSEDVDGQPRSTGLT